jgi:RNA polymerase sigma factor (sigma-70 family)
MDTRPNRDRREQVERMERAIRRLPRLTREIFLAHRLDGLAYDEIARRMDVTVREVEQHLAQALFELSRAADRASKPSWKFW